MSYVCLSVCSYRNMKLAKLLLYCENQNQIPQTLLKKIAKLKCPYIYPPQARQLETELDLTSERLALITLQLEEKEKSLMASEAEMNALNRRVQGLEEDLERNEEKLLVANQKLDKVPSFRLISTGFWRFFGFFSKMNMTSP